jgi:hypothetical protein
MENEEFEFEEPEDDPIAKEQDERDAAVLKRIMKELKAAGFDAIQLFVARFDPQTNDETVFAFGEGPWSHRIGIIKLWLLEKGIDG